MDLLHPLDLQGAEIPGICILRELTANDAPVVWQLHSLVLSWSAHPENGSFASRPYLEQIECEMLSRGADPLGAPCGLLAGYMAAGSAERKQDVAWACLCISDWATSQGFHLTAAEFLKAAALSWPQNARYALIAARRLQRRRRVSEAEHWFRRAYRVAVWTDDRTCRVMVLMGWAMMLKRLQRRPAARRLFIRAVRAAGRYGFEGLRARAQKQLGTMQPGHHGSSSTTSGRDAIPSV